MKLRKRAGKAGPEVQALSGDTWISLNHLHGIERIASDCSVDGDLGTNLISVLRLGPFGWQLIEKLIRETTPQTHGDTSAALPFQPASFRDFMLFEKHVIDSTRGYVKRFMPRLYPVTQFVEKVTGKPFKKFRPHKLWYQQPIYYLSNHLNFATSGAPIRWPSYTKALDYELELGAVLAHPLFNATAEEASKAIGGFVVLNDVSARDVQKDEMESGFGPQKAKHFASTLSDVVITADEILPRIDNLTASVSINDIEVAQCNTGGMQFSFPEAIAFASMDEQLHVGELFGSGTIPGGTGMENGHWVAPGDTVSLRIDAIGEVTNKIQEAY